MKKLKVGRSLRPTFFCAVGGWRGPISGGEYSPNDVESIRSQVKDPSWSKIVGVMSKSAGQKVDVHLKMDGGGLIHGLLIVATQPKELVVVNIVGPIDLEKLSQLEGQFGIPKLDLDKSKAKPR